MPKTAVAETMTDKPDFIQKAHEANAAHKRALEHDIRSDQRRSFFSTRGRTWKDALLETLAEQMAHFWIAVFPFVLVGGIGAFALSSWLGISLGASIAGIFVLTVLVFAFFSNFS